MAANVCAGVARVKEVGACLILTLTVEISRWT
jgi:hypothetical protein